MTTTQEIKEMSGNQLAYRADCSCPDSTDSPGAHFLSIVRDSALEILERDTETIDIDDLSDDVHEVADGLVPVYTHELWVTFVDLGAYSEDIDDYGPIESLEQSAMVALYMVAERLLRSLLEDLLDERETLRTPDCEICADCAIWQANGDSSGFCSTDRGCSADGDTHTSECHAVRSARPMIVGDHVGFGLWSCSACGSRLAGDRFGAWEMDR